MEHTNKFDGVIDRRSFVKNGLTAAGFATAGVGLVSSTSLALADEKRRT